MNLLIESGVCEDSTFSRLIISYLEFLVLRINA